MRAPKKHNKKKISATRRLFNFIDKNKLVFSLDTRYWGVLDFGYKFGIVPNSIEPPKVAPSIIASLVKRAYASLLIPNNKMLS